MRIVFLFFSVIILFCNALPSQLKCFDDACTENVSSARTTDLVTSVAGDLKELKKSAKVNIKGKNVNSNEVYWLVEFDGYKGLFNSSFLKEINNTIRYDLKIVKNPLYEQSNSGTIDETEDIEDSMIDSKSPLKSKLRIKPDETEDTESTIDEEMNSFKVDKTVSDKNNSSNEIYQKEVLHTKTTKGLQSNKENLIKKDINENVEEKYNEMKKSSKVLEKNPIKVNTAQEVSEKNVVNNISFEINNDPEHNDVSKTLKNEQNFLSNVSDINTIKSPNNTSEYVNKHEEKESHDNSVADKEKISAERKDIITEQFHKEHKEDSIINDNEQKLLRNLPVTTSKQTMKSAKDQSFDVENSPDKNPEVILRSPLLIIIFNIEQGLHPFVQSFINKFNLSSWMYLNSFVQNCLCMSLDSFIKILIVLFISVIVVYIPKLLRLNRDYKYEFGKQSQLVGELESRLQTIEIVRQKMTTQNRKFEEVIEDYKAKVNDIQDEAALNRRNILADLDRIKKSNENKIQKLSRDLEVSSEQYQLLERTLVSKEAVIEGLVDDLKIKENEFTNERIKMKKEEELLQTRLLELDVLKDNLRKISNEKNEAENKIVILSDCLTNANRKYDSLQSCFEHFEMFQDLGDEERRQKVEECLDSRDIRLRLKEVEIVMDQMDQELMQKKKELSELEAKDCRLEQRVSDCEIERCKAVKGQESAEMALQVMTEYFHGKEKEAEKSLGHDYAGKNESSDQIELWRMKALTLETDNDLLTKSVQKLKSEVTEWRTLSSKCKNEANSQLGEAFLKISTLERDLNREREESKKLRNKLSNHIGPAAANIRITDQRPNDFRITNQSFDRMTDPRLTDHKVNGPQLPPMFNLDSLPRVPFSGRSSANSASRKSNNS